MDADDLIHSISRVVFAVGERLVQLAAVGFAPDFIASSAAWGVSKPSPEFFSRIIEACGRAPDTILYVGDCLDNDELAARAAGMRTAFIRRGPWGFLHARRADAELADLRIDSLDELAELFQVKV